jgi:hypothetical protein
MPLDYIEKRPEREGEILALNLWQFTEAEQLNKLLGVMSGLAQETMDVFVDISKGWMLTTSSGVQLDILGEEIGLTRGPYNDEEFKLLQLIISKFRNGNVSRDGIIEAVQIISGDAPVDIYIGQYKNTDITFFAECRSSIVISKEIPKLFPIVSSIRLLAKVGIPFGFAGDPKTQGFGSVSGANTEAGTLVSLVTR